MSDSYFFSNVLVYIILVAIYCITHSFFSKQESNVVIFHYSLQKYGFFATKHHYNEKTIHSLILHDIIVVLYLHNTFMPSSISLLCFGLFLDCFGCRFLFTKDLFRSQIPVSIRENACRLLRKGILLAERRHISRGFQNLPVISG